MVSTTNTLICPDWYQPLLVPVSAEKPCGDDLEYHAEFIMLQSRLQPRMGAEYGDFVEAVDPVNWGEVEKEAKALLLRSLDLRLILILMRCRFRRVGIAALEEGLAALHWALMQWPEQLHPQLYDDGFFDPLMRANVLTELVSPEGVLGDLRLQPLPKAAGLQLSVRDVERARLMPHDENTPDENTLAQVEQSWLEQQAPPLLSLQRAEQQLSILQQQLTEMLDQDVPDLSTLFDLLKLFSKPGYVTVAAPPSPVVTDESFTPVMTAEVLEAPAPLAGSPVEPVSTAAPAPTPVPAAATAPARAIETRTDALLRLREIQQWFIHHEPSSPVGELLAFTEQVVGKRFAELMQILPQDLIARLSQGQES